MPTQTTITYVVSFGPKNEKDREWKLFHDEDEASAFFQEKQKEMHCSAYEEITTVVTRKIS